MTTSPTGANYALFPGVQDKMPPPATPPLRVGVTPVELRDLPPGEYTIFFQYLDWPVERTGITLAADTVFPVDFIFPYGCAVVTSEPDGAQIFHGDRWLGKTPLTAELPVGSQQIGRAHERSARAATKGHDRAPWRHGGGVQNSHGKQPIAETQSHATAFGLGEIWADDEKSFRAQADAAQEKLGADRALLSRSGPAAIEQNGDQHITHHVHARAGTRDDPIDRQDERNRDHDELFRQPGGGEDER